MPEKRLVIFDLDNTLVINRPAAKAAYLAAIRYIAKEAKLEPDKLHNHWKRIAQKLSVDKRPEMRAFEYSLSLLAAEHNIADSFIPPALKMYQKELLSAISPMPGAKEIVSWLKEQGCSVAVTAGTDRGLAKKKLKTTNLLPFIDLIVSTSDVGTMKPDSRYFTLAMENFGVKPTETLVVSDSKTEDLELAAKMGLGTIMIATVNPQLTALKPELSEFLSFAK